MELIKKFKLGLIKNGQSVVVFLPGNIERVLDNGYVGTGESTLYWSTSHDEVEA